jgi:hypothetical protein
MKRIQSLNPEFTALLMRLDPDHPVARRYGVMESATDELPSYYWFGAGGAPIEPDNMLKPITGSIPRITNL